MPTGNEEVPVEETECTNLGVSIAWLARSLPAGIEDRFDRAWDLLQADPAWREWLTTHHDAVKGSEVFNVLQVEDRAEVEVRFWRHRMIFRAPAGTFDVADVEQAARQVIRDLYCARATRAGVPDPPPV